MPGTLLAATDAPTPLPQTMMPRSALPRRKAMPRPPRHSRGSQPEPYCAFPGPARHAAVSRDRSSESLLHFKPGVIGPDGNAHRLPHLFHLLLGSFDNALLREPKLLL